MKLVLLAIVSLLLATSSAKRRNASSSGKSMEKCRTMAWAIAQILKEIDVKRYRIDGSLETELWQGLIYLLDYDQGLPDELDDTKMFVLELYYQLTSDEDIDPQLAAYVKNTWKSAQARQQSIGTRPRLFVAHEIRFT